MLMRLSAGWARVEIGVAAALAASVTLLILLHLFTRSLGAAVFRVDELRERPLDAHALLERRWFE